MRNISNRDLGGGRDGTGIMEKLEAGPQRRCIVLSLGMGRSLEAAGNFFLGGKGIRNYFVVCELCYHLNLPSEG